ncbi:G-type lectin S-receptor-like serine/threonine-protein kinase [Apostasia shenzhenica]|uniref:Receptor-like serine/threonine-protein kinase n=1 Tax=Apostasia shenzhenica TaxID=1088818 RepID=A0A2I0AQ30_9ASPA|nr:G-type lectin S-receptor-like serine/threonine-protein kinase [Apostasia shenzhenica]
MGVIALFFFSLAVLGAVSDEAAAAGIALGSTLRTTGSSPWTSSNNTFSMGFISDPRNPSLFQAAITYTGGVSIWTAGGASGVVDSGGTLQLLSDGNLRLSNGSGAAVWESGTANRGVSSASLDESGNLRLTNASSAVVWQTFDNPTDTIVESQNFTSAMILRSGIYSFTMLRTGNLTLKWNSSITYYNKGLNSSVVSNKTLDSPVLRLQSNGILSLFDNSLPSSVVEAYSSDYGESGDFFRFVKLDKDGNLRAYSVPRGSNTSTSRWSAVSDQCEVFGLCGNMGICSYNDSSPICSCPSENFQQIDPNDSTQGCQRKVDIQQCPGNSTMLALENTQFLTYPPETSSEEFFVGITACRLNCLSGGSCSASTSLADGSGLCYLKVSNFVSGYQSASLPSTSFVKVCAPAEPNPPESASNTLVTESSKLKAWVVVVVILATILGLMAIEYGLWQLFCRNSPKFGSSSAQYALLEYASGAPVQFSFKELQRTTKNFKEKLGAGGFGAVYKGVLANRTVVAVKQLEGIEQGEKQFRMEVATISSTHHLNLVRLIGFCSEGRHRLLVYEFMKNGSLDNFIFFSGDSAKLNWAMRYKIAIGTAKGITYLHEECRDCIVHCDIKPENILLDENYNAKVSDFGLAKLVNPKDHRHRTLTSVRGTRGYLAPEWLANLPVTSKSDVYSYGMVLLEIISGRRNFDVSEETGRKKFSTWAFEEFERGNIRNIIDRKLPDSEVDMEQVERAVQVSFWCVQEQPSHRPSIGKVVQMLEGIMEIEKPPAPKSTDSSSTSTSVYSTYVASGPHASSSSSAQGANTYLSMSVQNPEKASFASAC